MSVLTQQVFPSHSLVAQTNRVREFAERLGVSDRVTPQIWDLEKDGLPKLQKRVHLVCVARWASSSRRLKLVPFSLFLFRNEISQGPFSL